MRVNLALHQWRAVTELIAAEIKMHKLQALISAERRHSERDSVPGGSSSVISSSAHSNGFTERHHRPSNPPRQVCSLKRIPPYGLHC